MRKGIERAKLLSIIDELSDQNGYVSKSDLIKKIYTLNETNITKINPEQADRINGASDIIGNITRYQNEAKLKGSKTSYKRFISEWLDYIGINEYKFDRIELYQGKSVYSSETEKIAETEFVKSIGELSEILQVTRQTISVWIRKNIVKQYRLKPLLKINGTVYEYPKNYGWIGCYYIDDIKQRIKELNK